LPAVFQAGSPSEACCFMDFSRGVPKLARLVSAMFILVDLIMGGGVGNNGLLGFLKRIVGSDTDWELGDNPKLIISMNHFYHFIIIFTSDV